MSGAPAASTRPARRFVASTVAIIVVAILGIGGGAMLVGGALERPGTVALPARSATEREWVLYRALPDNSDGSLIASGSLSGHSKYIKVPPGTYVLHLLPGPMCPADEALLTVAPHDATKSIPYLGSCSLQ
jgi:hypothetical protein